MKFPVQKNMKRTPKRQLAVGLALLTAIMSILPAGAAGLSPASDETYYATLDYYGGLMDSSVVKSIRTFGNPTISDYGVYDEVINLTDSRAGALSPEGVTFDLSGDVPDKFYFEGKTTRPFDQFPWSVSLSYKLNGLPAQAEELAGQSGVVEITLDALPKADASEYSRNNLVLTAVSMFNGDDILSLEAPGAQVQLIGNLYAVLYAVLPGEEQHFTIRAGTDSFTYSGMILLAVPATLEQLDQVADLRKAKEETEDSYRAMLDSMHAILDSMEGMSGSLAAAASGLDQLNESRGIISGGKGQVYDSVDAALGAGSALTESLKPLADLQPEELELEESSLVMAGHLTTAQKALTETNVLLNEMSGNLLSLRPEVEETRRILQNVQADLKELKSSSKDLNSISRQLSRDLEDLEYSADRLGTALGSTKTISPVASPVGGLLKDAQTAKDTYNAVSEAVNSTDPAVITAALKAQGITDEALIRQMIAIGSGAMDQELQQAEMVDKAIYSVNGTLDEVSGIFSHISTPAGNTMHDLADLASSLRELSDLLEDLTDGRTAVPIENAQDVTEMAMRLSSTADVSLNQLEELTEIMNTYDPELQQAIADTQTIVVNTAGSLNTLIAASSAAKDLLQKSGPSLDQGTRQTLSGISAALRRSTAGLEQMHTVRAALDAIDALITDQWDSHTGEDNNVLLMDASAPPQSLTDSRNQGVGSIQYIMRTQEITVKDAEEDAPPTAGQADNGTIWSRIAAMFRDIWTAITGIFS